MARVGYLLMVGLLALFALSACSGPQENSGLSQNGSTQVEAVVSQVESQAVSQQAAAQVPAKKQEEPSQPEVAVTDAPQAQPAQAATNVEQVAQPVQAAPAAEPASATSPVAALVEPPAVAAQPANPPADLQLEIKSEVGFQAPDFNLATLDGQSVRLGDLRGRPVVISYWATWCVPCKQELPILQQLSQEFAASGIQILTIDAIEQDSLDNVHGLVGQMGLTLPVLLDQQNQFQSTYNQLFFPTSYFIDSNGVIRWIKLGDASEAQLRENIEKLINNQL